MSQNDQPNRREQPGTTPCDEVRELIPAYTIGATDPAESRLVESMLSECPDLADELEIFESMSQAMLFSAPEMPVSADASARMKAGLLAATASSAPRIPTTPRSEPAPAPSVLDRLRQALFPTAIRLSPALAALALVLLVLSNVFWASQVNEFAKQQTQLSAQVEEQNALLQLVAAGETHRAELPATGDGTGTEIAAVVWNPDAEVALLYAQQFETLTPEQVYQLWLIRGDQPQSAGLFRVNEDGTATVIIHSDEPLGSFELVGITAEPDGGSPAPTSAPIVAGALEG